MKGDFSRYDFPSDANFTGTLFQQGRAFSDQDGNAADAIGRELRTLLGRDAIGPHAVGVPAESPAALQVLTAQSDGSRVQVSLNPGRAWVDGLPLTVSGTAPLTRDAPYLGPPVQSPAPSAATIAAGVRDALVLEVWEESFSAYQAPIDLIEPALGGPDTTERVVLHHTLGLLRLQPGEECGNLAGRLVEDLAARGHLSVTPAPTTSITGDCPVQAGGGYTGFEHYLYRIEVATPDGDGNARFKYSRFNGGLVGRGVYDNAVDEILIRANDQMINLSPLSDFYLEVLAPGPAADPGRWQVVLTADATLVADGRLSLANLDGAWPGLPTDEAFFRLWDGVRLIQSFPTGLAQPNELEESGIRLAFDPPAADLGNYRPGDYWTFPVRAAGVAFDPSVWPSDAPPQGVRRHRAPLAILRWNGGPVASLSGSPAIHDCRRVFQPLTRIQSCCRFRVGDGLQSFGDFDTIQAALNHLPPEGGEICVLAGTYRENLTIERDDVILHGCGDRSRIISPAPGDSGAAPAVVTVSGHSRVCIADLALEADEHGVGVLVETDEEGVEPADIALERLAIAAATESAVKVLGARRVTVRECRVAMADTASPWHAFYLRADELLVEHNTIRVKPREEGAGPGTVAAGRGGVHLAGTCMGVQIIDNLIEGGIGNGITLGSLEEVDSQGGVGDQDPGWVVGKYDPCNPCAPGSVYVPPTGGDGEEGPEYRSAGALYEVRIERNRIRHMGLAGIGVVAFFDLEAQDEFISVVGLDLLGNEVSGCLRRELAEIPENMRPYLGYGAVTLADVEQLRCHDNRIENNGPDHQYPLCGLFILHGEALDICRNRILNNGAKSATEAEDAQQGRRGGIAIVFALPGLVPLEVSGEWRPRQNGEPAARIHHNVVSQPLGQALFLQALGPVSVQGNQLTSRGLIMRASDPSFWAAAVLILNLGWSNEFYLQLVGFTGATADPIEPGDMPVGSDAFVPRPRGGLDDFGVGRYMANGNVQFNDNQVFTDLAERQFSFAISSVLLVSLDDVTVQDNQLDCDFLADILFTNLIAVGMTVRVNNNRFKETLFITLFSSVALGLIFNNTSDNQATHCILNLESPLGTWLPILTPSIKQHDNQVLFNAFNFLDSWCERLSKWEGLLTTVAVAGAANNDPTHESASSVGGGFFGFGLNPDNG